MKTGGDGAALLIIDMLNDLTFDGGEALRPAALAAARVLCRMRAEARRAGVPILYVNDNHDAWHDERSKVIAHACREGTPGAEMARMIAPADDDLFVIKPRFSGFYATSLPVLLPELGVSRLILTGVAADICVLFTAADAHMRDYELWVPADAVASEEAARTRWALDIMKNSMAAETRPSTELNVAAWLEAGGED